MWTPSDDWLNEIHNKANDHKPGEYSKKQIQIRNRIRTVQLEQEMQFL